jgi:hypothetical protein
VVGDESKKSFDPPKKRRNLVIMKAISGEWALIKSSGVNSRHLKPQFFSLNQKPMIHFHRQTLDECFVL